MHAHTNYTITIYDDNAINAIGAVLKDTINDVEFDIGATIEIRETYACVFDEEIRELAKAMAKAAPDASFKMSGVIDTSETAGEYMDFCVELKDKKLTAAFSDWYLEDCMECFEDYEEFCESVMECTEEEYAIYREYEFLYTLETENGDAYSDHVPLHEPVEIDY